MRVALTSAIAAILAVTAASSASAAPVITSPATLNLVDLGTGNGAGFQNATPHSNALGSITFSGATTGVYSGSAAGNGTNGYTSPFGAASNRDYYAVEPGGSITIAYTAAQTSFALLIGTLDNYNNISFTTSGANGSQTFSGADIANALGMNPNGSTTMNVMFSGLNAFNTITLTDNTFSAFEFVPGSAVPEPAAWSMMILGMGAIGFAMRRRNVATRVSYAA